MVERRPLKPTTNDGVQPPTLEARIAAALSADLPPPSTELQELISEVEAAIEATAQSVEQARITALDPLNLHSAHAFEAGRLAQLSSDRLGVALQRLQPQLAAALAREYTERWNERFRRVNAMVEQAAEKYRRYPLLLGEMLEMLQEAERVDREVGEVNGSAPDNEHRRLRGVELTARGLDSFNVGQPSIAQGVRLPDWQCSEQMAWPPPQRFDPSLFVPVQIGDPRLTTDRWHEVAEEQRASEEARQKREAIEADRARREFYRRR